MWFKNKDVTSVEVSLELRSELHIIYYTTSKIYDVLIEKYGLPHVLPLVVHLNCPGHLGSYNFLGVGWGWA